MADGKRTGHWIEWFVNENKKCEGDYLDDKKTGHWTESEQDHIGNGHYLNGKRIGQWILTYGEIENENTNPLQIIDQTLPSE